MEVWNQKQDMTWRGRHDGLLPAGDLLLLQLLKTT